MRGIDMKRKICTFLIALATSFTIAACSTHAAPAPAAAEASTEAAVNYETQSLAEFARGLFTTTERPDLDEAVYHAFEIFEQNKDKSHTVYVYTGTEEQCIEFYEYFNNNYGFTEKLIVDPYVKNGEECVAFSNTLNADESIAKYKEEALKAKSIAAAVKGDTTDQTIGNILSWIDHNLSYDYNKIDRTLSSFGAYNGKPVVCTGYAKTCYQLCAMNGIPASIEYLRSVEGTNHAANRVTFGDGITYWIDPQIPSYKSTEIFPRYQVYTTAEKATIK